LPEINPSLAIEIILFFEALLNILPEQAPSSFVRYEAIQAQAMTRQPPGLHRLRLDCFTAFAMTVDCVHNDGKRRAMTASRTCNK
jgi:hypothetical protein